MIRFASIAAGAAACLLFTVSPNAAAPTIPDYFFNDWTVTQNCAASGAPVHVVSGLKFYIWRSTANANATRYALLTVNTGNQQWPAGWKKIQVEFRPGTRMTSLPSEFECMPGEEAGSSSLGRTEHSTSAEPYYEFEHWYGLADLQGERHHVLVFVRADAPSKVVIVLHDADAGDGVHLDHDGTIHGEH
jgi:hypothetical protein